MEFVFYPKHEFRCPHVGHCPHLGGASSGSLVLAANDQSEHVETLHAQLDAERRSTALLVEEEWWTTSNSTCAAASAGTGRSSGSGDSA